MIGRRSLPILCMPHTASGNHFRIALAFAVPSGGASANTAARRSLALDLIEVPLIDRPCFERVGKTPVTFLKCPSYVLP